MIWEIVHLAMIVVIHIDMVRLVGETGVVNEILHSQKISSQNSYWFQDGENMTSQYLETW